jgi:hypothetical protein
MSIAEAERWLSPVVNYDQASMDEAAASGAAAVVSPMRVCRVWLGSVARKESHTEKNS